MVVACKTPKAPRRRSTSRKRLGRGGGHALARRYSSQSFCERADDYCGRSRNSYGGGGGGGHSGKSDASLFIGAAILGLIAWSSSTPLTAREKELKQLQANTTPGSQTTIPGTGVPETVPKR